MYLRVPKLNGKHFSNITWQTDYTTELYQDKELTLFDWISNSFDSILAGNCTTL